MAKIYKTSDVYPYDTSYKPIFNVPIVTGASMYTDRNTMIFSIIIKNKALYFDKKFGNSLIHLNRLRS